VPWRSDSGSTVSSHWVVKPAEADAERVRVLAVADAEKMKIQAEAAASNNRVAVLNGADGLGQMATGLVGQGLAIFESGRGGLGQQPSEDGPDQIGLNASPDKH
jgi:flotillin